MQFKLALLGDRFILRDRPYEGAFVRIEDVRIIPYQYLMGDYNKYNAVCINTGIHWSIKDDTEIQKVDN